MKNWTGYTALLIDKIKGNYKCHVKEAEDVFNWSGAKFTQLNY